MTRFALPLIVLFALSACGTEPAAPPPYSVSEPAGPAPPTEVTGQLLGGDETLRTGEFMDRHEVLAREGQWIRAELISGDFDPYLIVLSPTGDQEDVDDSQEGNLSATKSVVRVSESGEWTIAVTTYEPGESGSYTLTYEVLDARPEDAKEGQQVQPSEADDETSV